MAKGVKDGIFQVFLFFFYNQVLGVDPFLTGVALTIALAFDSVTDPLVGAWSDQYRSDKWGRRHPFMLASAVPLGITLYLLFVPPSGLSEIGLMAWLTVFAILVRLSLTLFIVPGMSLGAEMSTDYEERTSITTYRITFATLVAPIIIFIGFTTFFTANEEYANGMFRAESYPKFALFAGIIATISILWSCYSTRSIIPHLPQNTASTFSFKDSLAAYRSAFSLSSFRKLILYIFIFYVAIGIGIIFSPYYVTYFFSLSETQFAIILLSPAPAGILAFIITPLLNKYFDKKPILIVSSIMTGVFFSAPYNLRFLGLFPENDSTLLFPLYFILITIGYASLWVSVSISHSMMADVVDEYELKFNQRKEGVFFAAVTLAYKATTGIGSLLAGILLKIIDLPDTTDVKNIAPQAVDGIGYVGGPLVMMIYIVSTLAITSYGLSRLRHGEIRKALDARAEYNTN